MDAQPPLELCKHIYICIIIIKTEIPDNVTVSVRSRQNMSSNKEFPFVTT